jgi:hypothetical protein
MRITKYKTDVYLSEEMRKPNNNKKYYIDKEICGDVERLAMVLKLTGKISLVFITI